MEIFEIENLNLVSPRPVETTNVLLVDDDSRNLDALESILAAAELRLVRVQTAEDALLALVNDEFACIVLDIQMPTMSGIELSHLIKTRKRSRHIPIIFLTAYFLEEKDILQGYDAGAVDYLTKPVNAQILKSKVGGFVDLFRKTRALALANAALEQEIIQRKKAEAALQEINGELERRVQERTADLSQTEQRYRQLVHGLPAAVYTTDASGRVTLYNEAALALWGREPEIGKDVWCGSYKIFNPDGTPLPLNECPMAITLKTGRAIRGREIVIERPDGSRRNILPYPEPLFDFLGEIIGAVNMLVDITDRKRAEEAARRLAAIVETSDDAIISKDLNGIITSWNDSAQRLFGYEAEEMIGKPVLILIPPERFDEEPGILESIRNGRPINHYETVRLRKDGASLEISLTVSPIKDADGKIIGASKIARDITEQKRAEKELKQANEKLIAASRAKDDFLAILSHELRTPLNPILLIASDAANNRDLPPRVRTDFNIIRKNVELEARLIDDLLDLTRITRDKIILDKQPLTVRCVLEDALANVQEEINQKQIAMKLDLAASETLIFADAVRLQQIFWNVLKNAVKFTPPGGSIIVAAETLSEKTLAIKIIDSGIGLTPDEITRIFDAFSQGDHAAGGNGHRFGGLGLGLAISKKLLEFHSGQIRASSDGRDQGSTFVIELPLAQNEPNHENSKAAVALPTDSMSAPPDKTNRLRVLLVEDHEPTRTALAQLLTRRNYEVSAAASLADARILADAQDFNLLISDIGLPDGTGHDLMAELRKHSSIKGIALTGYGMEQDLARSQHAGFLAHLTKPVRIESLDAALNTVLK